MSQPPPASADERPSTSPKNARTFSASGENTIACMPVITPVILAAGCQSSRSGSRGCPRVMQSGPQALIVGVVTVPAFRIRPMTAADARTVAAWRYPGEYSFYDADADADDLAELLNPAEWGYRYFAADEVSPRELAGFVVVKLSNRVAELGLGLRPGLDWPRPRRVLCRHLPSFRRDDPGRAGLYPRSGRVQSAGDHCVRAGRLPEGERY